MSAPTAETTAGARAGMAVWLNPRVALVALLGFSSGLPLALTGSTLQAWYTVAGVDLVTIGYLSLVGLPYTWKFLWAPLLDRFGPARFGRRRGWMLATQGALAFAIAAMPLFSPQQTPYALALLALFIAFASATQDIAVDAWRTDALRPPERGPGTAMHVTGYRLAMLASGAGVLLLADGMGFEGAYLLMATLMGIGIAASLMAREPAAADTPHTALDAWRAPLAEFFGRPRALALLAFIVLYKLGDAWAGTLTVSFLLRGAGFTPADVGLVNKGFGLAATIVGVFAGGAILARNGLWRSLLIFGVLQALSNLGFAALALAGHHYPGMVLAVGFENLSGGLGTAAFVALLMALCDHRYTATQFALLSALSAVGRVLVGPAAGHLAEAAGWSAFFAWTTLAAVPGLVLLYMLRGTEVFRRDR